MKSLLTTLKRTKAYWNHSIRRQLMLSFSLVSFILMMSFSYQMYTHQRDFLYKATTDRADGLAHALASSSASWVLANDVAGLQEVVLGFSDTPDLKFALVLSPRGEVLASTEAMQIGHYVSDKVSISLLASTAEPKVLISSPSLVDVAIPIIASNQHIGWARVEITRASSNANLQMLGFAGIGFSILAVVAALLVAAGLARRLTRSLYHLINVTASIEQGKRDVRSTIDRDDEVGKLAHGFNRMLDYLNDSEKKLGRINRLYSAWMECSEIIVQHKDEHELQSRVCQALSKRVPFELVWIGVVSQDGWVLPVASSGIGASHLSNIKVSVNAGLIEGHFPISTAIRNGIPKIFNDFLNAPESTLWGELPAQLHFRSVAAFPIFRAGHCYGGIAVYSAEAGFFTSELISLMSGIADDITFALNNLDLEKQRLADVVNLERAAKVFEYSKEGIMVTNGNNEIISVNRSFTEVTGFLPEEVMGRNPSMLSSGRQDKEFYQTMWKTLIQTGSWQGELWNRRKEGEIYPESLTIISVKGDDGSVINYIAIFSDITQRKAAEDEIQSLAFYDPLTTLPNRRLLVDRLNQALVASTRSGNDGAVLFLDLDHFKTLNDTLGHDIGDLLLQQVAQRLTNAVREGDTVARLGGDEFVIMLEDLSASKLEAAAQTEAIGEKVLAALNQPYQLATHEYHNTPSIGVALFSDHYQSYEDLLKHADIAMYQAKKAGRNTLRFFDPQMQASINTRVDIERELRKALEQQQFHLYYQMQVDHARHPLGAEALIRWMHPERGLVPPLQFIPLAEETGLILPIGLWVLKTACAQLQAWQQDSVTRDLTLSINVSAKQFRQVDFVAQVQAAVKQYGIDPLKLKLELTESMLLDNVDATISTMHALKEIGIRFSLDDFGTGYSSLQYLKQLPIYQLKIDQSFVRDIAKDSSDQAIVRTIIAMADTLNLNVIAEGVETEEQQVLLLNNGCKHYQGYLFGKPVPIAQFEAALKP